MLHVPLTVSEVWNVESRQAFLRKVALAFGCLVACEGELLRLDSLNEILTKAKVPKSLLYIQPVYYSKALVVTIDYEPQDVAGVFNVYSAKDVTCHDGQLHSWLM